MDIISAHKRPRQGWAHLDGKVDLRPLQPAAWDVDALAARAQIADVFYRFGVAWDEARVDVLCTCFTDEGLLECSEGDAQPILSVRGHDAMREILSEQLTIQADQRRHLFSNVMVEELDLDQGVAKALAQSVVTATGDTLQLAAAAIYTADLRREPDGCWRFVSFFIGMDRYAETG